MADDGWVQQLDRVRVGQIWEGTAPPRPGRHVYIERLYDPTQATTPTYGEPMAYLQAVVASPSGHTWLHAGNRPPIRLTRLTRDFRLRHDPPLDNPG